MPQDLFEIALEHHRAGRLTQAEAGYRAAIAEQPDNPDAMHWLGVLLFQAGQISKAIPLLESAVARRGEDAAFRHNLGQAYMAAGRKDEAIVAFERAASVNPVGSEPLAALAHARLSRGKQGDADAAVAALQQARKADAESSSLSDQLSDALLVAGRYVEAIEVCRAALLKRPNEPMLFYRLALASRGDGQTRETRKALIKALELEPTMAQGWCALAMLDAEAGNFTAAASLFRRAIAADRDYRIAYEGLADVLGKAGKPFEAQAAVQQVERLRSAPAPSGREQDIADGSVADLERQLTPTLVQEQAHFAMAALLNVFPPVRTPGESVSGLFDRYAPKFDEHLVGKLDYDVPQKLVEALQPFRAGELLDILDAGCGTGLCGPLLRARARTLVGVDLSAGMIEKARQRGVYDRLEVADLIDSLRNAPLSFDLLVCADVLIYVGESAPFFDAALGCLRRGGLLAISVEACEGDRYDLVPRSRRYRHSKPYLRRLASIYGFEERHFQETEIRKEMGNPVSGYLVILQKPR